MSIEDPYSDSIEVEELEKLGEGEGCGSPLVDENHVLSGVAVPLRTRCVVESRLAKRFSVNLASSGLARSWISPVIHDKRSNIASFSRPLTQLHAVGVVEPMPTDGPNGVDIS